jgi:predicted DsbA family dithiol-disulfide isomerase
VEVSWHGFELHPEVPPGGRAVAELFGAERAAEYRDYLQRFAAGFDVPIGWPDRVPNTRRALALTEHARDQGKLEPLRDALMAAHWLGGRDIEADEDLGQIADGAGLAPDAAVAAADDPDFLARVDAAREQAHALGVTGIPTFLIGERRAVGCQPFAQLARLAEQAGIGRR